MKLDDVKIGDSISVNGVCLSITEKTKDSFSSDLSSETLSLTTFIEMRANSKVNLEKAMNFSSRVNGHLIAGHVDGVGVIKEMKNDGRSILILIEFPEELEKYISKKGSIAVDGVSLTINGTKENTFSINIIPHTLSGSIISEYNIGTKVNIEVDLIARYLEKLVVK
jgi:riboflavin synthase